MKAGTEILMRLSEQYLDYKNIYPLLLSGVDHHMGRDKKSTASHIWSTERARYIYRRLVYSTVLHIWTGL